MYYLGRPKNHLVSPNSGCPSHVQSSSRIHFPKQDNFLLAMTIRASTGQSLEGISEPAMLDSEKQLPRRGPGRSIFSFAWVAYFSTSCHVPVCTMTTYCSSQY